MSMIPTTSNQQGAGLIEVLVSLLVLGVGLLGVLSLQSNGLNSNQRAVFVTEAQLLAQDMANRIMAFGDVPTGDAGGGYGGTDTSGALAAINCVAGCSAAQARSHDQAEWAQLIDDASLPSGRGTVAWADNVYIIRVMWDQDRLGGAVACNPDNCYELELILP